MAKKDMLKNLDEVVEGADVASEKKVKSAEGKKEMKMKNLKIPVEWDEKIKAFTGSPSSGYMAGAIKDKMIRDGLL